MVSAWWIFLYFSRTKTVPDRQEKVKLEIRPVNIKAQQGSFSQSLDGSAPPGMGVLPGDGRIVDIHQGANREQLFDRVFLCELRKECLLVVGIVGIKQL